MYVAEWVDVDGLSEGITSFTWVADEDPEEVTDTGALVFRWKTGRSKRREPAEYIWYVRLRAAAHNWETRLFDALYEAGRVENGATSPAHRRIDVLKRSLENPSPDIVDGAYRMFTAAINANQSIGNIWGDDAYYAAAIIAFESRRGTGGVPSPDAFDDVERDAVIDAHTELFDPVSPALLDVVGSGRAIPDADPDTAANRVAAPPKATQERD